METKSEFKFLLCPRCGGKTRTQVKRNGNFESYTNIIKDWTDFQQGCIYLLPGWIRWMSHWNIKSRFWRRGIQTGWDNNS